MKTHGIVWDIETKNYEKVVMQMITGSITIKEAVIELNTLRQVLEAEKIDNSRTILALQSAMLLFQDLSYCEEKGIDTAIESMNDEDIAWVESTVASVQ